MLRLRGIDLGFAARHVFESIDPSTIRLLSFQDCENESSLLSLLAPDPTNGVPSLGLQHLAVVQQADHFWPDHDGFDEDQDDENDPIDEILASFDTLPSLVISTPDDRRPMASTRSISNHQDSLKTLYLEYGVGSTANTYTGDELCNLFGACRMIEQLALNFPDMS